MPSDAVAKATDGTSSWASRRLPRRRRRTVGFRFLRPTGAVGSSGAPLAQWPGVGVRIPAEPGSVELAFGADRLTGCGAGCDGRAAHAAEVDLRPQGSYPSSWFASLAGGDGSCGALPVTHPRLSADRRNLERAGRDQGDDRTGIAGSRSTASRLSWPPEDRSRPGTHPTSSPSPRRVRRSVRPVRRLEPRRRGGRLTPADRVLLAGGPVAGSEQVVQCRSDPESSRDGVKSSVGPRRNAEGARSHRLAPCARLGEWKRCSSSATS